MLEPCPGIDALDQETEYLIHVVTGSDHNAGNVDAKCHLYISIIGGFTQIYKLKPVDKCVIGINYT